MLTQKDFKIVDSTLQSLRSAGGLELQWVWKGKETGWVCAANYNDVVICELHAATTPIRGVLPLPANLVNTLMGAKAFPVGFKALLQSPVDDDPKTKTYELELESTELRDLLSELVSEIVNFIE